jgi:hypothetical protein
MIKKTTMRKKITTQQITYAEIITHAIQHISERIRHDNGQEKEVEHLKEKRALLRMLYLIETGTEYEE